MRYYSNVAALSTVANVGGISTGATEVALSTSTGFPSLYPYTLRMEPDSANEELVTVTGPKPGVPGTFLISRAQDGTTAKSHAQGSAVVHGVSARDFQETQDHMAATSVGTHGLPASAFEQEFTIYKNTDQGYSNDITLNDDSVLRFNVLANTKYRVELFAICSGQGGNIKLAWKVPSGTTTGLRACTGPSPASTSNGDTTMRSNASQMATEVVYGLASVSFWTCIQERFILPVGANAGEVVLQHAQSTSHADQTVMRGASYMIIRKLA